MSAVPPIAIAREGEVRRRRADAPGACLALLVLGAPAEEAHLDLADTEGHHDADQSQDDEGDHHVRGVQRAQRLDDEVAQSPARLAADELADDGGIGGQNEFPAGQPLLRRPTHSGSITVGYTRDRFSAVTSLFVKGASVDRDFSQPDSGNPRVNLPGYQKLDLSFAYVLFKDVIGLREVVWKTRFQNVLNQQYEEVFGFSAPRLSALTGIEVRY